MSKIITKYPLITFFTLAYAISWAGWIPQAAGQSGFLFSALGTAGPTLAAVIVTAVAYRHADNATDLLFAWRAHGGWYAVAFLLPFILVGVGMGVLALTGSGPDWSLLDPAVLPGLYLGWFFTSIWEEIGWRGFAQPHLQKRYSAVVSALILGVVWGLWHLPLAADVPLWLGLINGVVASGVYAWLYNSSGGAAGVAAIHHVSANVAATVALTVDPDGFMMQYALYTGLTAAVALALIGRYGMSLSTTGRVHVWPIQSETETA